MKTIEELAKEQDVVAFTDKMLESVKPDLSDPDFDSCMEALHDARHPKCKHCRKRFCD